MGMCSSPYALRHQKLNFQIEKYDIFQGMSQPHVTRTVAQNTRPSLYWHSGIGLGTRVYPSWSIGRGPWVLFCIYRTLIGYWTCEVLWDHGIPLPESSVLPAHVLLLEVLWKREAPTTSTYAQLQELPHSINLIRTTMATSSYQHYPASHTQPCSTDLHGNQYSTK